MQVELDEGCRRVVPSAVRLAQRLIRIRSRSFDEGTIAREIQGALERLEYDLVVRDDVGNVIGVLVGSTEGPTLLLHSHMDTGQSRAAATIDVDELSGRVRHGRIHGHGAAACKSALAAQIYGCHVLDRSPFSFRGNLVVATTVAEHDGYGVGTDYLVRNTLPKLGLAPHLAILGEPTGFDLCHGGSGRLELLSRLSGRDERAVRRGTRRLGRGVALSPSEIDGAPSGITTGAPSWRDTGTPEVTLPISCVVPAGRNAEDCAEWVRRQARLAVADNGDLRVDVSVQTRRRRLFTGKMTDVRCAAEPWRTDRFDPWLLRVHEVLRATGWKRTRVREWSEDDTSAGMAGSILAYRHRIPTFGFGPGDARSTCRADESVATEDIHRAILGTAVVAHAVLGRTVSGWSRPERLGRADEPVEWTTR